MKVVVLPWRQVAVAPLAVYLPKAILSHQAVLKVQPRLNQVGRVDQAVVAVVVAEGSTVSDPLVKFRHYVE
jgi:hypothetical protein